MPPCFLVKLAYQEIFLKAQNCTKVYLPNCTIYMGLCEGGTGWNKIFVSMKDLLEEWLPLGCRNYYLKCFVIAGVFWVLWNIRNKIAIEGVFP